MVCHVTGHVIASDPRDRNRKSHDAPRRHVRGLPEVKTRDHRVKEKKDRRNVQVTPAKLNTERA